MKKTLAVVLVGAMTLSMTACPANEAKTTDATAPTETTTVANTAADTIAADTTAAAGDETVYKIGVPQLIRHATLDQSNEGFFAALDDAEIKHETDQQNAAGEQSSCQAITEELVDGKDDLILAIATPATQAVTGVTTEIPILLAAVTNPAGSGLVNSNGEPGVDVSSTSNLTPMSEQIDLMKQLVPDVENVDILHCSAESSSMLWTDVAKAVCDATGLTYKGYTVSNSNEIQTVMESMIGRMDAIYVPTDNTMTAGMATVAMIATDSGTPVICGEAGTIKADGLATYGIDYFQLGYLASQQAIDILVDGADVAKTPIGYLPADKCALAVSKTTTDALGIDITGPEGANVVEQLREN